MQPLYSVAGQGKTMEERLSAYERCLKAEGRLGTVKERLSEGWVLNRDYEGEAVWRLGVE